MTPAEQARRGRWLDEVGKATGRRKGHRTYVELKQAHERICGPVARRQFEADMALLARLCGVPA